MHARSKRLLVCCCAIALALPAHALQTVVAKDGVSIEAIVSTREPTRIRVDGAKIVDVIGNIHSSSCNRQDAAGAPSPAVPQINPQGEFVLGCDLPKGEIYLRPVGKSTKPINIFVTTDRATYTLILRRSDVPADTIVISDKSVRHQRANLDATATGKSAAHVRAVKAMLLAMAGPQVPSDYSVDEVREAVPLWAEARFVKVRVVTGARLVGEQYLLTNTSNEPMVLAEQEFDRDDAGVVAVSVEQLNLRPGESTTVYLIRSGE